MKYEDYLTHIIHLAIRDSLNNAQILGIWIAANVEQITFSYNRYKFTVAVDHPHRIAVCIIYTGATNRPAG